ncbi:MAG: hypothetical protein IJB80_00525 [Clostridia bacterium]|nr:hypothetical protein [Clostridia bacterium]
MYRRYPSSAPVQRPTQPMKPPPPKLQKPPPPKPEGKKKPASPKHFLAGWIPSSLYNPETKKVLGVLSAEDLLLAGLIFLLLENEEEQDSMLVYALLYILLSDYIDLPF